MTLIKKIEILAGAARYDVSCASSGSSRKNTRRGPGNASRGGICHTFTEDGRCVSLLKILFTNVCIYNCAYCVNRSDNDIPRASFTSRELIELTLNFYRRNYIEGLFLSSGVKRSPDHTMEQLIRVARELRTLHGFQGYIHLKCVPNAASLLVQEAGRWADRLSVNIELPSEASLKRFASEKSYSAILNPMALIRERIDEHRAERKRFRHAPLFSPAGQSTQLIIGASPESDYHILRLARDLYDHKKLTRVYYSAYVPTNPMDPDLSRIETPPLLRENRLYQADWLLRFYGFSLTELLSEAEPDLEENRDPKMAYALRHLDVFPVDINRADYEMLLRVPGIGLKSARTIIRSRRHGQVRLEHLHKMGVALKRAVPFIECPGASPRHTALQPPDGAASTGNEPNRPQRTRRQERLPRDYTYDHSFDGLLTVLYEAFARREMPRAIRPKDDSQLGLFDDAVAIVTDPEKATRVWRALRERLGEKRRLRCLHAFLSGAAGIEMVILRHVQQAHHREGSAPQDDGDAIDAMLQLTQAAGRVRREAHRMRGLVRFEAVTEELFVAPIAPRYDVLPLIRRHFEQRYATQNWVLYDTQRRYGLFWDTVNTREVRIPESGFGKNDPPGTQEGLYPDLWKTYFQNLTIPERRNPKLHLRQLPRYYWPYLPEKALQPNRLTGAKHLRYR